MRPTGLPPTGQARLDGPAAGRRTLRTVRDGGPGDGDRLARNARTGGRTARCYCWMPDAKGKPFAIAVGTDVQNSIYVCRLVDRAPARSCGISAAITIIVTSLGVSRDLRYLVSGSADGTMRFWSLAEYAQGTTPWAAGERRSPCVATNSGDGHSSGRAAVSQRDAQGRRA